MKAGPSLTVVAVLGGIWIGIAPFVVGYGPGHGPVWTPVVALSVWLGIVIAGAGLIGLMGFWTAGLGDMDRRLRRRGRTADGASMVGDANEVVERPRVAELPAPAPAPMRASEEAETDPDALLEALIERVISAHEGALEKTS
jgi:hypothetical protein